MVGINFSDMANRNVLVSFGIHIQQLRIIWDTLGQDSRTASRR